MLDMKEVKIKTSKNFYLLVFQHLKQGIRPSKICEKLGITKQRLNYYLATLKRDGFVKKIGYGVWEILKDYKQTSKNKYLMGSPEHLKPLLEPDKVRGHAFLFTVRIPKLEHWANRREILKKNNIDFKPLNNMYGNAELIRSNGRKVILTPKSLMIYEKSSYFADTSNKAQSLALYELGKLIKSLEKQLGANFSFKGQYKIKISRQHYALIKNSLARQYDEQGKKLACYFAGEQWLVIDNSFNLHELETIHPATSPTDNEKVLDFFNSLKKDPMTTTEIKEGFVRAELFGSITMTHQKTMESMIKQIYDISTILKDMKDKGNV